MDGISSGRAVPALHPVASADGTSGRCGQSAVTRSRRQQPQARRQRRPSPMSCQSLGLIASLFWSIVLLAQGLVGIAEPCPRTS